MADGSGILRRQVQRPPQRLLGEREIAQVPGLAGLLDVRIAQRHVTGRVLRTALDLPPTDQDGLISRQLGRGRRRARDTQDGQGDEHTRARAGGHHGTSGPQGLPPGPVSPQSTWRRFLPSYGVGRNGKLMAIPFAVMSTPTVPGAPARKLTPSPARALM